MIKEFLSSADINKSVINLWESRWSHDTIIHSNRIASKSDEYRRIKKYIQQLPLNSKIIDAGCGPGYWTIFLHSLGYHCDGLDFGNETIGFLQKHFPNINFMCNDIRSIPVPDELYNAYISWGVIEHFENGPDECLKEAWRVLKPGGLLMVSVPFHNVRIKAWELVTKNREILPNNVSQKVFYQYRMSKEDLNTAIVRAGFSDIRIYPIHKWHGFIRLIYSFFNFNIEKTGEAIFKKTDSKFLKRCWLGPFYIISQFFPSFLFSHMLLAVATKNN